MLSNPENIDLRIPDDYCQGWDASRFEYPDEDEMRLYAGDIHRQGAARGSKTKGSILGFGKGNSQYWRLVPRRS